MKQTLFFIVGVIIGGFVTHLLFSNNNSTQTASFTDVTDMMGIHFTQHTLSASTTDSFYYMTGGVAVVDFDNDGWQDIYFTSVDGPDALYKNHAGVRFEDVSQSVGLDENLPTNGAVWGDVDNDGDQDLFLTTVAHSRYYLYINQNGQFIEAAIPRGVALESTDLKYGYSASMGDYDNDGYLDIHTTEWTRDPRTISHERLFRNLGTSNPGYFEDVTSRAGVTMENHFSFASQFVDLDSDGFNDLIIASDFGTSKLFWNNGDGTFTDGTLLANFGTEENGMGLVIVDVNNDTQPDIFVTSVFDPQSICEVENCKWGDSGNRLYVNRDNRLFTDMTDVFTVRDGGWGWAASSFDYNNDSQFDIIQTAGMNNPNVDYETVFNLERLRLWHNAGTHFDEIAFKSGVTDLRSSKGLAILDFDNDGDQDFVMSNNGDSPVLYQNNHSTSNNYLRLLLEPQKNSADTLTAVLTLDDGSTRTQTLHRGSNYLGQNESILHFGLGTQKATSVTVTWTDGSQITISEPEVNTLILVSQGSSDSI